MQRGWIRAACLALLMAIGVCAGAGIAKASAALGHACCERPASDDSLAQPMRCDGFLPLSCCEAAALPGGDGPVAAPILAIALEGVAIAAPPSMRLVRDAAAPARRLPPAKRSVVLQL